MSPGLNPVPNSAAIIKVTTDLWECLTASGNSRVVPEVYWYTHKSLDFVATLKSDGCLSRELKNCSSAFITGIEGYCIRIASTSWATIIAGSQSFILSAKPSGPNKVKRGTAIAPRLIAPKRQA